MKTIDDDRSCNCQGCSMHNSDHGLDSLCSECREALDVGRLILKMYPGISLEKTDNGWFVVVSPLTEYVVVADGNTALEALRKGLEK